MAVSSAATPPGDSELEQRIGIGPLTSAEQRLVEGLLTGEFVDAADDGPDSTDGRGHVRADLIRRIMLGRVHPYDRVDPHGLQLANAYIADRIDLNDISSPLPLALHNCTLPAGIALVRATLHNLHLYGDTTIAAHTTNPAVHADEATINHDLAIRCRVTANSEHGAVRLFGARIGGQLDCCGATVTNEAGPTLYADGLTTTGQAVIAGTFTGAGELGAVRLPGAHIGGQLQCAGVFTNDTGPALYADGLAITTGQAIIVGTFTGSGDGGALRLPGAHIGGQLQCTRATVTNDTGPALGADGLTTTGHTFLDGTFVGSGELSAVRLLGTRIGGQFICAGTFTNRTGPALTADGLTTTSLAVLRGTFTGAGELGAVRLLSATIGRELKCDGTFTNRTGPALTADGLTSTGNASFPGKFTGSGDGGALRLDAAHIGGQLNSGGGTVTNDTGPALHADRLTTTGHAILAGQFTGSGKNGALRLPGAHIDGKFSCTGGTFTNRTGPALTADGLTTTGDAVLNGTFIGSGDLGAVRLIRATIAGQLRFLSPGSLTSTATPALRLDGTTVAAELVLDPAFVTKSTPGRWLALDRLTYRGLPHTLDDNGRLEHDRDTWTRLLRDHSHSYAAQPWQHLAAAHRAAGHEQDAKRVLIAQQDDRRRRAMRRDDGRWHPGLWCRRNLLMGGSKLFTGYGYRTSRTLIGLLAVVTAAVALGLATGSVHVNAQPAEGGPAREMTAAAHRNGADCSHIERIGLGLEWGLPIIKTAASTRCVLNATDPAGQWLTAGSWLIQAFAWALATLVIAGYTGIIRRV